MTTETQDIKNIIKTGLLIVNDLASIDIEDIDMEKLEKLVKRAKIIKNSKHWDLK